MWETFFRDTKTIPPSKDPLSMHPSSVCLDTSPISSRSILQTSIPRFKRTWRKRRRWDSTRKWNTLLCCIDQPWPKFPSVIYGPKWTLLCCTLLLLQRRRRRQRHPEEPSINQEEGKRRKEKALLKKGGRKEGRCCLYYASEGFLFSLFLPTANWRAKRGQKGREKGPRRSWQGRRKTNGGG